MQQEEKVSEKPVIKKVQTQLKNAPKSPESVDTDSEESYNEERTRQEIQATDSLKEKARKSPEFVETYLQDSGTQGAQS